MSEEKKELNTAGVPSPFGEEPDPGKRNRTSDEIYTGQEYRTSGSAREKKAASIGKDISILVIITLVAGFLLGAAYSVTKGPIATAQADARSEAQRAVMNSAHSFKSVYSEASDDAGQIPGVIEEAKKAAGLETTRITQIDAALDDKGEVIGYVITASDPDGYGGDVELMCGISRGEDGKQIVNGISFLTLTETAGMGMRAKDEEFMSQFSGMEIGAGDQVTYTKNGASAENEIDAISGCTITTSAVTDDVNAALIAADSAADSPAFSGKARPTAQTEAENGTEAENETEAETKAEAEAKTSDTEQEASK